jgi:hypothetical protein
MSSINRKTTASRTAKGRQSERRAGNGRQQRRETPLIIGSGESDQEALRSVIRGWLVPVLVRQFLAERGVDAPQRQNRGDFSKTVYGTHLQGARGKGRVNGNQ